MSKTLSKAQVNDDFCDCADGIALGIDDCQL